MTCQVLVWNFLGTKTAFGHASLTIDGGDPAGTVYVSWWPNCPPGGSDQGSWDSEKREYFGTCEPFRSRKLSTDVESEFGKNPDKSVSLAGLDETAMKKFWSDLMGDHQASWSASTTNCACAVVAALKAGGANKYIGVVEETIFDIFHTNWLSWTPDSAYQYALKLQGKLRDANLMQ